jgi:predicted nucleic acid-binding protein
LLDTSVWIAYLRPRGDAAVKASVQKALADAAVYSCEVVRMELLVGSRDEAAFGHLEALLRGLGEVSIDEGCWERGARLGFRLRREGITVPLPDLLIAQTALDAELTLWHADEHFELIRAHSPLRTRSFLSL